MYIGKNRTNIGDRSKSPLQTHNHNRGGRRTLALRRVDQANMKRHCIPPRDPNQERKQYMKYENALFDTELKTWHEEEQLPPYHDHRFDIPLQKERINLGRKKNLPRRVRKDCYPTLAEAHSIDAEAARAKLTPIARPAFEALRAATWERHEWTKARHVDIRVDDVPMTSPMPSHFMRVSTRDSEEHENLLTPIHSAFLRSYWTRLGNLPEFTPMDVCAPIDEDGEEIPNAEYATGELPLINVRVHNLETMPHLVAYCYQRNPAGLVEQLVGNLADDFHEYVETQLSIEQRQKEWTISQKLAAHFDSELIRQHAWFIHDLAENANCVGLDDNKFWWALDTALRMIMDALIVQKRFCSSGDSDDE